VIIGTVQSTELFEVATTVDDLGKVHAVQIADTRQQFDRAARAWLVGNRSGCSGGFADVVLAMAWERHTARTVRLELTASELAQFAGVLAAAPATVAGAAVRRKVADAASRMGIGAPRAQEQTPGKDGGSQ